MIISGGPGTGKTFIAAWILFCLVRLGFSPERIKIAAPTGRAAEMLTASLRTPLAMKGTLISSALRKLEGETIHRLLRYRSSSGSFTFHAQNHLPLDVIVVDEVSMVDMVMISRLFEALPDHARIILMGDKDQLSSVEAGGFFPDLLSGCRETLFSPELSVKIQTFFPDTIVSVSEVNLPMRDRVIFLENNHRTHPEIQRAALKVNRGEREIVGELVELSPPLGSFPREGCFLLKPQKGFTHTGILDTWARESYLESSKKNTRTYLQLVQDLESISLDDPLAPDCIEILREIFEILENFRILCLLREGPYGVSGVNLFLCRKLQKVADPKGSPAIFSGLPILILQNDYNRRLFNGDCGVVLAGKKSGYRAVFHRGGFFESFPVPVLPLFEPAFAITVHKSQGGGYGNILLILPDREDLPLLTREAVYTALTRASNSALIYGREEVLAASIQRIQNRRTGLDLF